MKFLNYINRNKWILLVFAGLIVTLVSFAIPFILPEDIPYEGIRCTMLEFRSNFQEGNILPYPHSRVTEILTADMNNDSRKEIIITAKVDDRRPDGSIVTHHELWGLDNTGQILTNPREPHPIPRWPLRFFSEIYHTAIGDIEGDGNKEIIVTCNVGEDNLLQVFNMYGDRRFDFRADFRDFPRHQRPFNQPEGDVIANNEIIITDIDGRRGDEIVTFNDEVIIAVTYNNDTGNLEILQGFPTILRNAADRIIDIAAGDIIKRTGSNEIVAITYDLGNLCILSYRNNTPGCAKSKNIQAEMNFRTPAPSFFDDFKKSPSLAIGDINSDGLYEIVFAPPYYNRIWILNSRPREPLLDIEGSPIDVPINIPDFTISRCVGPNVVPLMSQGSSLCISNFDRTDTELEIFKVLTIPSAQDENTIESNILVYKIKNGRVIELFPDRLKQHNRPIMDILIGEVTNDLYPDIITVECSPENFPDSSSIYVYIQEPNANIREEPIILSNGYASIIEDLDGDGDSELIYAEYSQIGTEIVIIDLVSAIREWTHKYFDVQKTSWYRKFCLLDKIFERLGPEHIGGREEIHNILSSSTGRSALGRKLQELYYKHGWEMWKIICKNPYLIKSIAEGLEIIVDNIDEIKGYRPYKANIFNPYNIEELKSVMDNLYDNASYKLKKDLIYLKSLLDKAYNKNANKFIREISLKIKKEKIALKTIMTKPLFKRNNSAVKKY